VIEYPTRRMLAAGVFYAGLALPLLFAAVRMARESAVVACVLGGVAASLIVNFLFLMKGEWVAEFAGCVIFGMLTLIAGSGAVVGVQRAGWEGAIFFGASFAYFGVGLLTVASLYPWVNAVNASPLRTKPPQGGADR
jgi:hypothetical protein